MVNITVWLDTFNDVNDYLNMQGCAVDVTSWDAALNIISGEYPSGAVVRIQWLGDTVNIFCAEI